MRLKPHRLKGKLPRRDDRLRISGMIAEQLFHPDHVIPAAELIAAAGEMSDLAVSIRSWKRMLPGLG